MAVAADPPDRPIRLRPWPLFLLHQEQKYDEKEATPEGARSRTVMQKVHSILLYAKLMHFRRFKSIRFED